MDNFDLAKWLYGMCDMSVASEISSENAINSIFEDLESISKNDDDYSSLMYYITNAAENMQSIEKKIKNDILQILDHECEVFDPICDGPVEHAEGMGMAREFVENYFKERGF